MAIDTITIVGLGALGTMYADFLVNALPPESVRVVADKQRRERYQTGGIYVNGKRIDKKLVFVDPTDAGDPADLVIFACKYTALPQAMEDAANQVGDDTTILSVLNGVVSEGDLAQRFGVEKVLLCVAQEMDTVRVGNKTTYKHFGRLALGMIGDDERTSKRLDAVEDLFYDIEMPFWEPSDIQHQMWSKLMYNDGINQACAVFDCPYGGVQRGGVARDTMLGAMRETAAVAQAEGIDLTEKDIEGWKRSLDTLDPSGMPSMKQDADAHRKTEVALFGETVCNLARKHRIATPINDMLVRRIHDMEAQY
jgi:2-dehydropantoate 2-reductase